MAEYSRLAKGRVSSLGGATPVILPFVPDYVQIRNYTASTTPASGGVIDVYWDSIMGQGAASYNVFNATPVLTTATTSTNGISTFSAGYPQLGAAIAISGITKASPAQVTTGSNHGLVTGNVVMLQGLAQSSSTGMQQLADIPFVVTVTGATTFTIPFNTNQSNFTALSGSPANANVRQVLYPNLYSPGIVYISTISTGSTTTITTMSNHNFVVGQMVSFRIPSAFGTIQLNSPNSSTGNPVYGFVTAVNSAVSFTVNINSSAYTAFNSNQTVASALAGGFTWPQVVAAGDVNTGGVAYSGGALYPSPSVNSVSTINGPGISGAFINNTSQGFIIGSTVAGTAADVLYFRAFLHDYSNA